MADLITLARAQVNPALANAPEASVETWITAASQAIENYCDRVFTAADYVEKLDGNGLYWIYVRNAPVNTLTQIVITDSGGTDETISGTNFKFDARTTDPRDMGRICFAESTDASTSYFYKGCLNVTVTYNGGYETIPADIQEACVQACVHSLAGNSSSRDPSLESEKMGEYSYKVKGSGSSEAMGSSGLPVSVESVLDKYRRLYV